MIQDPNEIPKSDLERRAGHVRFDSEQHGKGPFPERPERSAERAAAAIDLFCLAHGLRPDPEHFRALLDTVCGIASAARIRTGAGLLHAVLWNTPDSPLVVALRRVILKLEDGATDTLEAARLGISREAVSKQRRRFEAAVKQILDQNP